MLEQLKNELNKTTTLNGDLAFKSTKSSLLDFFSRGGAMRKHSERDIVKAFALAFAENSELALKALFYFRDIREGQGERRLFRVIIDYLADTQPERMEPLVCLIPEYGRWDDLLILLDTKIEGVVLSVIKSQLEIDLESEKPSLLAKWLPSENATSRITKLHARYIREALFKNSKEYRQTLSKLRAKIKLVETDLSNKECGKIDYSKVPSKAGLKYRTAFHRNDGERYTKYLESVTKGEAKINTGTLYPYELYDIARRSRDATAEVIWKNLPNYVKEDENALVMADVSGSMNGRPMSVSVSLAIYFAERNKGAFANHYLTFSSHPVLVEVKGNSLHEKINFVEKTNVGYDTNLELAFNTILKTAVDNKLEQKDLPKKLYIISDMQFNSSEIRGTDSSTFQRAKTNFMSAGYIMPEVVFWNVNSFDSSPVTMNDYGVQLVSGFSPVLFKQIVSGLSAYDLMLNILNKPRYENIR